MTATKEIKFSPELIQTYKTVGCYRLEPYGCGFEMMKKPNWFHRLMVYLILGWRWEGK